VRACEFISENKVRPNIDIEWDGNFNVYAFIDGKRVGHAEFASDDPEGMGGFYAVSVGVNPEYRRMGVATAMYDAAEEKFGEIIPSESQTDDARAFWRSRELSENLSNTQMLRYIKKIHPDFHPDVHHSVLNHEEWELINYPVDKLRIADEDDVEDPYNRIIMVDPDYASDLPAEHIKDNPIVVDADGYIIDGNHRAYQAKKLGLKNIPAYVPYEEI